MKPCKISAHSDKHSDNIFLWGVKVIWMSWNFFRFHKITNQRDAENFKFLCWQTKKFHSLKIWSVPGTMNSSFFSQQMAPWRPNFPHQRLWSLPQGSCLEVHKYFTGGVLMDCFFAFFCVAFSEPILYTGTRKVHIYKHFI